MPLPQHLSATLVDPERLGCLGEQAAEWVRLYRERHGCGPTWLELGEYLHPECTRVCCQQDGFPGFAVQRVHAHLLVTRLKRKGWLQATQAPRSLQPGPALEPAAARS